ncbi:hypothetical protein CXG81DRAFT_20653 [Caulochytrium protostelioides]|uniref:RNA polymerase II-associated protein 1 C-terminal domain-containing protein n=1 Tax=Caulochytrium protostelioides TaxID=1555241 RepID=A0A4P9X2T8_9FUNG|nr:hypothetical protein CXG81DRAFT_20653 [Caulochytrium protostelioides]|eukprot:RKO99250.1 hypothetical protein CXG81DRAFT_20653 [Caulochytrium protostelioides]
MADPRQIVRPQPGDDDLELMQQAFHASEKRPAATVVRKAPPVLAPTAAAAASPAGRPVAVARPAQRPVAAFSGHDFQDMTDPTRPEAPGIDRPGRTPDTAQHPAGPSAKKKLSLFAQRRLAEKQKPAAAAEPAAAGRREDDAAGDAKRDAVPGVPDDQNPFMKPKHIESADGHLGSILAEVQERSGTAAQRHSTEASAFWAERRRTDGSNQLGFPAIKPAEPVVTEAAGRQKTVRFMPMKASFAERSDTANDPAAAAIAVPAAGRDQTIHDTNVQVLSGMSEQDKDEAYEDIMARFDPELLKKLEQRILQRSADPCRSPNSARAQNAVSDGDLPAVKECTPSLEGAFPVAGPPSSSRTDGAIPMDDADPLNLASIPKNKLERDKLAWMLEDAQTSSRATQPSAPAPRFDLHGAPILDTLAMEHVNLGLHHHGEESDHAGYTLAELLLLMRSTEPHQVALSCKVIRNLIQKARRAQTSSSQRDSSLGDEQLQRYLVSEFQNQSLLMHIRLAMDHARRPAHLAALQTLAAYFDISETHAYPASPRVASYDLRALLTCHPRLTDRTSPHVTGQTRSIRSMTIHQQLSDHHVNYALWSGEYPTHAKPTAQAADVGDHGNSAKDSASAPTFAEISDVVSQDALAGLMHTQIVDRIAFFLNREVASTSSIQVLLATSDAAAVAWHSVIILQALAEHSHQIADHLIRDTTLMVALWRWSGCHEVSSLLSTSAPVGSQEQPSSLLATRLQLSAAIVGVWIRVCAAGDSIAARWLVQFPIDTVYALIAGIRQQLASGPASNAPLEDPSRVQLLKLQTQFFALIEVLLSFRFLHESIGTLLQLLHAEWMATIATLDAMLIPNEMNEASGNRMAERQAVSVLACVVFRILGTLLPLVPDPSAEPRDALLDDISLGSKPLLAKISLFLSSESSAEQPIDMPLLSLYGHLLELTSTAAFDSMPSMDWSFLSFDKVYPVLFRRLDKLVSATTFLSSDKSVYGAITRDTAAASEFVYHPIRALDHELRHIALSITSMLRFALLTRNAEGTSMPYAHNYFTAHCSALLPSVSTLVMVTHYDVHASLRAGARTPINALGFVVDLFVTICQYLDYTIPNWTPTETLQAQALAVMSLVTAPFSHCARFILHRVLISRPVMDMAFPVVTQATKDYVDAKLLKSSTMEASKTLIRGLGARRPATLRPEVQPNLTHLLWDPARDRMPWPTWWPVMFIWHLVRPYHRPSRVGDLDIKLSENGFNHLRDLLGLLLNALRNHARWMDEAPHHVHLVCGQIPLARIFQSIASTFILQDPSGEDLFHSSILQPLLSDVWATSMDILAKCNEPLDAPGTQPAPLYLDRLAEELANSAALQEFTEIVDHYQAASFGDSLFMKYLLFWLFMPLPQDYRETFWQHLGETLLRWPVGRELMRELQAERPHLLASFVASPESSPVVLRAYYDAIKTWAATVSDPVGDAERQLFHWMATQQLSRYVAAGFQLSHKHANEKLCPDEGATTTIAPASPFAMLSRDVKHPRIGSALVAPPTRTEMERDLPEAFWKHLLNQL